MTLRLAMLLGVVLLGACTAELEREVLEPPPMPAPEKMEDAVRAQFEERLALLDQVQAQDDASDQDVGWALGQLGRLHQAYRHLDQARWCYQQAHRLDQQMFDWAYLLAHLELVLGDLEAAETTFLHAHGLRPNEAGPLAALGRLDFEAGDYEAAREHYQLALEQDPKLPLARYGMALVELELGHGADAIERLRRLLEEQPKAFQLHYALADAFKRAGRHEEARWHLDSIPSSTINRVGLRSRDSWQESIQQLPLSVTAIDRRGRQALLAGRLDLALRFFRQAAEIAPERREVRFNLATALARAGRSEEAVDMLRQVIVDFPTFDGAHRLLGRTLQDLGQPTEARQALEHALELNPESESNHRALADYLLHTGDLRGADEAFRRALDLDGRSVEAHLGRVQALLLMRRPDEAHQAVQDGLEANPRARRLAWMKLRTLATQHRENPPELAQQDLPAPPRNLFELESAAMLGAAQGDFDTAVHMQESAVQQSAEAVHRRTIEERLARYRAQRPASWVWVAGERARGSRASATGASSPSRRR